MRERLVLPDTMREGNERSLRGWGLIGWALAMTFGLLYLHDRRLPAPPPPPEPTASSYLPVDDNQFVERIRHLLDRKQPQQALSEIARLWSQCQQRQLQVPPELPSLFARAMADLSAPRSEQTPPPPPPPAPLRPHPRVKMHPRPEPTEIAPPDSPEDQEVCVGRLPLGPGYPVAHPRPRPLGPPPMQPYQAMQPYQPMKPPQPGQQRALQPMLPPSVPGAPQPPRYPSAPQGGPQGQAPSWPYSSPPPPPEW